MGYGTFLPIAFFWTLGREELGTLDMLEWSFLAISEDFSAWRRMDLRSNPFKWTLFFMAGVLYAKIL